MKALLGLLLCSLALHAEEPAVLALTKTIPLPGVKGRFDHLAFDPQSHRLFLAALGNDTLEVLDTAAGRHLQSLGGLHKPTGVLFLSAHNRIAVANGDDGTLKVFDGQSYALLETVTGFDDADNLRFDDRRGSIYLGFGAGALAVIDAATLKQTATIKLAAHPESFQLEASGPRLFVSVPESKHVAVVDRETRTEISRWQTDRFRSNFPMALDEAGGLLFIACRLPSRLLALDTTSGKLVASLDLSGDIDDLFFDPRSRRLYASCGEGFVDVIQQHAKDHYARISRIPTRIGARTSFLSPATRELFVAVPKRGTEQAELRVYQLRP